MKVAFWFLSLVSILLLGSLSVSAACPKDYFFKYPPSLPGKAERTQYAKHLLRYAVFLEQAVPALSPSEHAWLKREMAQSGSRQRQAFNSVENQKQTVRLFAEANETALRELSEGHFTTQRAEVRLWAILAANISTRDYRSAIAKLTSERMLQAEGVPSQNTEKILELTCDTHAHQIMTLIVIPYLSDKLPE